jgi:hypothetical protein
MGTVVLSCVCALAWVCSSKRINAMLYAIFFIILKETTPFLAAIRLPKREYKVY